MNVEFGKIASAEVAPALEAALKAANTPANLIPEGRKVFWDCLVQGYTLDAAIGAALSKRAPDGGSWHLGRWYFWYTLLGVDINAGDKTEAETESTEDHPGGVVESIKEGAARVIKTAASKRTEKE